MIEKLLENANIPEEIWHLCRVENGTIYTPNMEVLYKNGLASEEEYQFWKSQQIDNCLEEIKTNQQLTEELKISQQQVADLEIKLVSVI